MKINEEFLEKTMSDVKIMFCDLLHLLLLLLLRCQHNS